MSRIVKKRFLPRQNEEFIKAFQDNDYETMIRLHVESYNSWKSIFDEVSQGKSKLAYFDCCHNIKNNSFLRYAMHRSTKEENAIQLSCMEIRNGEIIPTSDQQFHNFEEFMQQGVKPEGIEVLFL